ncbi:hypothetical protein KR093_011452, partial [Drosophila rubida]
HPKLIMDNDNKTPPDDEQQQQQPEQSSHIENVLQLLGAQVGETETDLPIEVSSSISLQSSLEHMDLEAVQTLVHDMIESILPRPEPVKEGSSSTLTSAKTTSIGYDDERLRRILRLLDRYTRNLEALEELVLRASKEASVQVDSRPDTSEQLAQHNELATQTMPLRNTARSESVRPLTGRRIMPQPVQQQPQLSHQQTDTIPPCERRQHIITISGNNSSPFASPPPPRTLMGRIGRTLGEFAGALCLCMQVNRDCIFCLGFFLAFVISASFLTAFFYRTINLTVSPARVPIDATPIMSSPSRDTARMRLNGGYYYIYNSNRQHFV